MDEQKVESVSLEDAYRETKKGNFKQAIDIYDILLSNNPDDQDVLINKSITLMNMKNYEDSLKSIEFISYESPHGFDKMLIEASCFYNLGKIEKAQDLYVKITNRIPLNKDSIIQIGSKCLEQGFCRSAVQIFSKLEDKAHKFEKNYLLGLSYKGLGELTNSIRAFGRALRARPDFYQLYPLTAATCFQNNMVEEGDKLMNILKDEHNALFQHVAGTVGHYRSQNKVD